MDITGNVNHVLDLSVKGQTGLKNLSLTDTHQKNVLTLDTIGIDIQEINPSTSTFYFNTLLLRGLATSFDLYKDHNNLTDLHERISRRHDPKHDCHRHRAGKHPLHLKLGKHDIADWSFTFNDHTLTKPFSFR